MRIALVQQSAGADPAQNRRRGLEALEQAARRGARLVAYPELSFTRFLPQCRRAGDRLAQAEPSGGETTRLFQDAARRNGVVVVLNLFERDGDRAFDTSPVIDADGRLLGATRMMHITQYEGFWEQDWYDPGDSGAPVYETAAGHVGVSICYDRHFPEHLRSLALAGAELVVVPQAGTLGEWPEGLFEAEMRVASFQNGFYTALVNRVGREEELVFAGGSFVTDPDGVVIARAAEGRDDLLVADIDPKRCAASHARRLFLRHRRPSEYGRLVERGGG